MTIRMRATFNNARVGDDERLRARARASEGNDRRRQVTRGSSGGSSGGSGGGDDCEVFRVPATSRSPIVASPIQLLSAWFARARARPP